jgi:predicted NBD/HSP70 family sugar kinase
MVQATRVIAAAADDPGCARALAQVAGALGRGIGALVNAQDPEVVGLSGLAAEIIAAAPDAVRTAYLAALMRFRRPQAPALLPSTLGDLGTLTGASELVFDAFLTPRGLGTWPPPARKTA